MKHYLDPKQTEGPHDVETQKMAGDGLPWWRWIARDYISPWKYATEAAALAAARKAAGYETEE